MTQGQSQDQSMAFYPIRVVSQETGVNAITLRAWERRYGLLTPKRTAKGHRLYSDDDIRTIKQVVSLLERGIPISQARTLIDQHTLTQTPRLSSDQPSQWQEYRSNLYQALNHFDEQALIKIYDEVIQFFPIDIVIRFLLMPSYHQLIEQRQQAQGDARLRFYAGFLQAKLAWRLYESAQLQTSEPQTPEESSTLIICNLGHDDDIPLLLLAVLLKQLGLRPLYFAGLSTEHLTQLLKQPMWQAALLHLPAQALNEQANDLRALALETGKPVFVCQHDDLVRDALKQLGLMSLPSDTQAAAMMVRDLLKTSAS